jgi:uncharacterized protein YqjF (DUF2071 family)
VNRAPDLVTALAPPLGGRAVLRQRWCGVTFLHWALPPDRVAPLLPDGVRPDLHDGLSYVGLVALRMRSVAAAAGPALPWSGDFLETNVRLYSVDAAGRRGVVFCSMDAERLAFVAGSRLTVGLPYRWSRMRHAERAGAAGREHAYLTRTRWPGRRGVRSHLVIRAGAPIRADADDAQLAAFLTARWGLHVHRAGRTLYLPASHEPWRLQRAAVLHFEDGLLAAAGFPDLAARAPDHVAYADGVSSTFGLPRGR